MLEEPVVVVAVQASATPHKAPQLAVEWMGLWNLHLPRWCPISTSGGMLSTARSNYHNHHDRAALIPSPSRTATASTHPS